MNMYLLDEYVGYFIAYVVISWACALFKELYLKPLGDVTAILLWPLYLPAAMIITSIHLAKKYLKVPDAIQEEPA